MLIREYRDRDLEAVIDCFCRAVRDIGARHYTPEQIAAWAPDPPDAGAWASRLGSGGVFVGQADTALAGFIRVEATGLIDLLYVHPRHARHGVGRELLRTGCAWALQQGARGFESDASIAARPFFEAMDFRVEREQSVERNGVWFRNYRMVKHTVPDVLRGA